MKSDYQLPINIGSNQDVSISSLASIILMVADKNIFLDYDNAAPQGVRGRNADISLAKEILKWQPKIGLEEGLRTTYNWINDMMNEV
jgi:nucleoside-diphosphate-sugar epimerase